MANEEPPRQAVGPALGNGPSPQEINAVAALIGGQRYAEAGALAQAMTERFPAHGFGWKVLGVVSRQMGRREDALSCARKAAALSPDDVEAHSNLGTTFRDLGRLDEAESSYRRALQIRPDFANAHYNLGNTLRDLGRVEEAVASYQRVLQIMPDHAEAHVNLGSTLKDLGRFQEAISSFQRALQARPEYAEAHVNLGNLLKDLGRVEEAMASCRCALQIRPDYAEAHSNLGGMLKIMGRLDEAESSYRRALQAKPAFVDALNNLAALLSEQGELAIALNMVRQSMQIRETQAARNILVDCLKRLRFTQDNGEIRAIVVRALTESWCRPNDLARTAINLARLDPEIDRCIAHAAENWPRRPSPRDMFGRGCLAALAGDRLLLTILASTPIADMDLERFLTMARSAMLDAVTDRDMPDLETGAALSFCSALARQCFINEYVFSLADDELRKASSLRDALLDAMQADAPVPTLCLLVVAAYFPLCSFPIAPRLLEKRWPEEVASVLQQQVREPAEELQLRPAIPRLTGVDDQVSLLVQKQYEDNPYPRWVKAAVPETQKNVFEYLCQKYPRASFNRYGRYGSVDVLVAGCGTGLHSIGSAQAFQGARILAVDLSIGSLAYAMRKTREMGLTSIDYAQADLLKLGALGRSFDIIEAGGVLHHLADPWSGWRVLLSLLRPGGFMGIGLYSKVARRCIADARAFIAERGYAGTVDGIRRCRQELIRSGKAEAFKDSFDFSSTSNCRDLLFHVQEHPTTPTEIDAFLRESNLAFLGFDVEPHVLLAYNLRFPADRAATNLRLWEIFEAENPATFSGMYQFWVQKSGPA